MDSYKYVIIGAGLTGASAVKGIRKIDPGGPIALVGDENHLPYHRPPLSKDLWMGKMELEKIFVRDKKFYEENGVDFMSGFYVSAVDPSAKNIRDNTGRVYRYDKLLLATGGRPRTLSIPGGNSAGVCYYRYLDDYNRLRPQARESRTALVIGGGFIGSELAASLRINKLNVVMVFPEEHLCDRVLPGYLAESLTVYYTEKGIKILNRDKPVSISRRADTFVTQTEKGEEIVSDILIAGIGITPDLRLAQQAGLKTENGIVVDNELAASHPDIYAAGDNASFPCRALGKRMRVEHWDNALKQGTHAGRNMAGAGEPFDYLPYFFSDLFDFSYEAVGEIDPSLRTVADWREKNRKGVIYYLNENKVRGVMLCNIPKKVSEARTLILQAEHLTDDRLRGAIKAEDDDQHQANL